MSRKHVTARFYAILPADRSTRSRSSSLPIIFAMTVNYSARNEMVRIRCRECQPLLLLHLQTVGSKKTQEILPVEEKVIEGQVSRSLPMYGNNLFCILTKEILGVQWWLTEKSISRANPIVCIRFSRVIRDETTSHSFHNHSVETPWLPAISVFSLSRTALPCSSMFYIRSRLVSHLASSATHRPSLNPERVNSYGRSEYVFRHLGNLSKAN